MLYTNAPHSLSTAYVWSAHVSVMEVCSTESTERSLIFLAGHASDLYIKILEEVQAISCATLFAPVVRSEAVQAMSEWICCVEPSWEEFMARLVLVSGWSDNGWLSGGHAVRMAMELCGSYATY